MIIDGEQRDWVRADDRGLTYGDGLFETLAVEEGEPRLWEEHMRRLTAGCRRIGMPAPDPRRLAGEATRAISGMDSGVLKVILTRGRGGRGYRPPTSPQPTRILAAGPAPGYPTAWRNHGVRARYCEMRLSRNPRLAGLKHLNRLEQVLARNEWQDDGIPEGLMLDTRGQVVDGTMTNLFLVVRGALLTPELDQCGVAGVMRDRVIDLAKELGLELQVASLTPRHLGGADALFLTNSLIGIWPIRELDGRPYVVDAIPRALLQAAWASALT